MKYLSNVRDGATGDQSDDFNVALTTLIDLSVRRSGYWWNGPVAVFARLKIPSEFAQ